MIGGSDRVDRFPMDRTRREIAMPGTEIPGNAPPYPGRVGFGEVLSWHLDFGTRPKGSPENPQSPWSNAEFAKAVGVTERTVRNWRSGRRPDGTGSIELVLFGDNPAFVPWRFDLR